MHYDKQKEDQVQTQKNWEIILRNREKRSIEQELTDIVKILSEMRREADDVKAEMESLKEALDGLKKQESKKYAY